MFRKIKTFDEEDVWVCRECGDTYIFPAGSDAPCECPTCLGRQAERERKLDLVTVLKKQGWEVEVREGGEEIVAKIEDATRIYDRQLNTVTALQSMYGFKWHLSLYLETSSDDYRIDAIIYIYFN